MNRTEFCKDSDNKYLVTVLNNMDAVVCVSDIETYEILFMNKYAQRFYGNKIGQLCWKAIQENQSGPCNFCTNKYLFKQNGKPAKPYIWEFQNTKDHRWYECHDQAIPWPDGRIVRLEIAYDITKRKQVENALQDSEELNREVISSAGEGIIVYDRQFRYQVWNRFMEKMTGIYEWEVLGQVSYELFSCLREQGIDLLLKQALAGKTVCSHDIPFHIPKTGKTGWIVNTYSPHRDSRGNIVGVVATIRDITERKRIEERLRESEDKYRKFMSSASDGCAIFDVHLNLMDINDSGLDLFVERPEKSDILGKNILTLAPNLKNNERYYQYLEVLKTGTPLTITGLRSTEAFGRKYVNIKAFKVGDHLGMIVTDITEQKTAQERQERQKLARDLHDRVNQYLFSQIYFSETLSRFEDSIVSIQAKEYVREIQKNARMAINEMKSLIFRMHPITLSKNGLVHAIQEAMNFIKKIKDIKTSFTIKGKPNFSPESEYNLYNIIQEALNNVVKHADATSVDIEIQVLDTDTTITITDNGKGFNAETEDSRGMGISNMHERIGLINGKLELFSTPGNGTRISIFISNSC